MSNRADANVNHNFTEFLPFEGALALSNVLGRLEQRPRKVSYTVKTPFGTTDVPFQMIPVAFRNGDYFEIPWGQYDLEEGDIRCGVGDDDDMPCFMITGFGFKDKSLWNRIIEETKKEVVTIYKGRALRMKFTHHGDVMVPEELNLSKKGTLIFNPEVEEALETSLFLPIENAQMCRDLNIPLKRGILLEGPYGMGKSLAANVTAHKALENGFTFLIVPDASMVGAAFKFAKRLAPAVVFVEDIDEFLKRSRDDINSFLNTLDGIDSKDNEVITVYSTNYIETIDRALLRPGRVDALISLDAPRKETVQRILNLYGASYAPKASEHLAGASPALIREVVERAKLLAMKRKQAISDDLLLECAHLLSRQRELTKETTIQKDRTLQTVLEKVIFDQAYKAFIS